MNLLRLVLPGSNQKVIERRAKTATIIRRAAQGWSPEVLEVYINNSHIPQEYIAQVVSELLDDSTLVAVQKEDFLAVMAEEYPSLFTLLVAPSGNAWLDMCIREIAKGFIMAPLRGLLRGK